MNKIKIEKVRGHLASYKNGKEYHSVFEYFLEYNPSVKSDVYYFDIWEDGDYLKRKFSFLLRVMENGRDLKVIDLYANDYIGRGISIAIILKSKELFKKRIISSSNIHKSFIGEANWPDAIEKVWKRLVEEGNAKYDNINDYYYVL